MRWLVNIGSTISPLFRRTLIVTHYTGHRIGAVRDLRWDDVDFTKQRITWRGEFDRIRQERITPMSRELITLLKHEKRLVDPDRNACLKCYAQPDEQTMRAALDRRSKQGAI